jgi:long-subunit acyl-CoA synthetase (AMP-forming)
MNWRTLAGRNGQMASLIFSVNRSISTIRAMPWGLSSSFPSAHFNTVKRHHHHDAISDHSLFRGTVAPLFLKMQMYRDRVAVVDGNGVHCYSDVLFHANRLTDRISDELNSLCDDGNGNRICILCPNDASYLMAQLATWMSGCVAVPLSDRYPAEQLEYFVRDSDSRILITTEELAAQLRPVVDHTGAHLVTLKRSDYCHDSTSVANSELKASLEAASNRWNKRLDRHWQLCNTNQFKNRYALIVYTSGTTGKPKVNLSTFNKNWHVDGVGAVLLMQFFVKMD